MTDLRWAGTAGSGPVYQDWPFHSPYTATPGPLWPTATQSVAARHETALKGLVRLVIRQLVPDQEMTGEPTAMQLASLGHDTPYSMLSRMEFGDGSTRHADPSQRSTRVYSAAVP